jgi:hypothetical protein
MTAAEEGGGRLCNGLAAADGGKSTPEQLHALFKKFKLQSFKAS